MTHSTVATERESGGSTSVAYHTIDVTSLDNAGNEQYDPEAEVGVDVQEHGIDIVGIENGDSYIVTWDHLAARLNVVDMTGSDVASGTDIGEIRLRVEGV